MESIHVANSILEKSFLEKKKIGHLTLQKLMYFTHAWYISITNEECLNEPIIADKFGPIVQSIYERCKHVGKLSIDEYLKDNDGSAYVVDKNNKNFWEIMNKVWKEYAHLSPLELSQLAHEKGSPWAIVKEVDPSKNMEIPNSLIIKMFMEKTILNQKKINNFEVSYHNS